MDNLCMSTKELIKTYSFNDIYNNRNDEHVKKVKGRTVIELGTRTATSFVGNLYRVFDYSVKSYKQLLLVGVAKQCKSGCTEDLENRLEIEAAENAWVNPSLKLVIEPEDSTVPFDEDYFMDLCIVLNEIFPTELIMTPEEMGIKDIPTC